MRRLALPLLVGTLALLAYGLWPDGRAPGGEGLDVAALSAALADLDDGLEPEGAGRGASPAPITFPRDYGMHADARAEVWEVSARLQDEEGRPVAVRLSLARLGLWVTPGEPEARADAAQVTVPNVDDDAPRIASVPESRTDSGAAEPPTPRRASAFATDALLAGELVMMAEGLIPDDWLRAQRIGRVALGLAGADDEAIGATRVWIERWTLSREADGALLLRAAADGAELALHLLPSKPPVVVDQTDLFSAASAEGASSVRFYSQPRLMASGTLRLGADEHALHGLAWLDHGWGEFAEELAGGRRQLVANRFQLQLEDGSEIACLHLRRRAGGGTPIPSCVLIGVDGATRGLQRRDLTLEPMDRVWTADDGVGYPLTWRLLIPARALELLIEPLIDDPAMALGPASRTGVARAWRGPVRVSGWRASDIVVGGGQMDLNGYGERPAPGT